MQIHKPPSPFERQRLCYYVTRETTKTRQLNDSIKPSYAMDTPYPLLSTAYFPPIAYMALLAKNDHVVIEQYETFHKQTLRNRTLIVTANGVIPLSVPVVRPHGNHSMTGEMQLSYHLPWHVTHWRTISTAYSSAPFFLYYKDAIERILLQVHQTLLELNNALLHTLTKALKIECTIALSEDFVKPNSLPHDYRNEYSIKQSYDKISFPEYSQVFCDRMAFQPNVGILDLLFNLGPEAKDYLLNLG